MIYKWELKSTGTKIVIHDGEIEADTQGEAMKMLNEDMDIQPHTDEILEIIAPGYTTEGLDSTL